jgi:hypothetical protein
MLFGEKKKQHISEEEIHIIMNEICEPVFSLSVYAVEHSKNSNYPCKAYLQEIMKESSRLQELLDKFGAQKNRSWFPVRETVASQKLFSTVLNILHHIKESLPYYHFIGSKGHFEKDLDKTNQLLKDVLTEAAEITIEQLSRMDMTRPAGVCTNHCEEEEAFIHFESNRDLRKVKEPERVIVYLATEFLNMAENAEVLSVLHTRAKHADALDDEMSEENLRSVEARFHNLQSAYDTYIFESDTEDIEENLNILRGHITLIYHLLEASTHLAHYYIRHMGKHHRKVHVSFRFPIKQDDLFKALFGFALNYSFDFLEKAKKLCRDLIQEYSEQSSIELPIPIYRGFHVRPSTLIAKIIHHYGSKATMKLGTKNYNPALPLDLFRANEEINALKRRQIADLLSKRSELQKPLHMSKEGVQKKLQLLFLELARKGDIILYTNNLSFSELGLEQDEPLASLACRFVKLYMSTSKLDVRNQSTVTFSGDSRALADIQELANNGYGEDSWGNNIMLPEALSYLQR